MTTNAPFHRASVVTSWKNNHCLESLEWPAQSPNLNPIENLWMVLEKAISKRCPPPKTLSDLQAFILEEWKKIPIKIVQALIESNKSNKSLKLKDLQQCIEKNLNYIFCIIFVREQYKNNLSVKY